MAGGKRGVARRLGGRQLRPRPHPNPQTLFSKKNKKTQTLTPLIPLSPSSVFSPPPPIPLALAPPPPPPLSPLPLAPAPPPLSQSPARLLAHRLHGGAEQSVQPSSSHGAAGRGRASRRVRGAEGRS